MGRTRDPDQISVDTNTSGDALQGQADTIRSFDKSEKILLQGSHSFAGQGMAPAEANTPSGTQSIGLYSRGRCGRRDN